MSIDKVLNKITKAQKDIEKIYVEALNEIFTDCPEIKKFELEMCEEYDDNNYYYTPGIVSINGVTLPEVLKDDYIIEDIEENPEDNTDWNTCLMAAKVKLDSLVSILKVTYAIPNDYFEHSCSQLTFEAKPKKEKKAKSGKAKTGKKVTT